MYLKSAPTILKVIQDIPEWNIPEGYYELDELFEDGGAMYLGIGILFLDDIQNFLNRRWIKL